MQQLYSLTLGTATDAARSFCRLWCAVGKCLSLCSESSASLSGAPSRARLDAMMFGEMFLKLIAACATVFAEFALKRLLVEMYPLVTNEVTFLYEGESAHVTDMRADREVGSLVSLEL